MTHEKNKKNKNKRGRHQSTVQHIPPRGESFSDLLSDLFEESAERISGSTEFSLKVRNRSFVCCCFFQHWHDGDGAHNEAEIETYQQPPCKLNLLLI